LSKIPLYSLSDFEFLPADFEPKSVKPQSAGNGNYHLYDGDERLKRASAYARALPGAIEGDHGDQATYQAAAKMRDFGLTETEAYEVLTAEFNPRCRPEWNEVQLREKVRNAYRYAKGTPGSKLDEQRTKLYAFPDINQHHVAYDNHPEAAIGITVDDFYAYLPTHSYIFVPSRDLWPAASVNARITIEDKEDESIKASFWLDRNRTVEQMIWAPGEPMLIGDRLISEGGWIERPGCTCFNLYRPPKVLNGDAAKAAPWLEHIRRVYGQDAEHVIVWLAHRVQKPQEKINHALVLGGMQGIGKDTLLEPVKHAIGPWNFSEISPSHLLGRFNGWIKSVILRINEARDLGDVDRYGFYDHLKTYTAAPPDVLRCDEKNIREYSVLNVCGVVLTTNYKTDGIYLPADDRRHFVAWSDCTKDDFSPDYWKYLYRWYEHEGCGHVAVYLRTLDISAFDPKAPPPKTDAFWAIVDANRAPEDAELSDAIEALGIPEAITLTNIISKAKGNFGYWLRDRKNSRQIPHRMEAADYVPVRNEGAKDGQWKIAGKRQTVYARRNLAVRDRIAAAIRLTGR
jgi:hypothetical protein